MALFAKVICIFFVSFSLPAVPQKTGPTKRPVIFNIKYSTHDLKFGKNLEQVILQLKGKKINPNTAKALHKSSLNSTAFKDFGPQAKRILGITKIKKSLSRFHQYCTIPSSQKNNPHPLYKKLNKGIDRNCRHIFINLMLKIKNKSNMNGKTLDYFKHALVFYLKSKNIKPLARYFKMVSSDSTLHRLISHYITDIYIKDRIKPHKRILSHMHINEKLTHHIQEVGLNDKKAHKYFVRELKKIVEQFKKMIVKEKYDEAQTFVDFALSFYDQNKRYIPQTLAWKIFLFAGKDFLYSKRRKKSVELFDYSLKLANNEDQRNESYFHLIWPHILDNDYKKAVKTIKKYKMMEKIPTFDSKIQFWMAYSLEQIGERQISRQLFNRLINNYPLHFYSIIALRRLERIDPVEAKKKIEENFYSPPSLDFLGIDNYTPLVINSIKRVLVWIELKQSRFLTREIKNTIRTKKTDGLKDKVVQDKLSDGEFKKQLTMNITYLLTKKKKYLQTFKLLHGSLDGKNFEINNHIIKLLFPFQYLRQIKNIESSLDSSLILALIRQESAFNPEARSMVGAQGLMQLMPNTARQFNRRLKRSSLNKPQLNLKIGIKYLKQLIKKYDGNLVFVLAAYNAGERRIRNWRKNIFSAEKPLFMIESIPFKETRYYIKLIYRNIFFYKLLKQEPVLKTPLEKTFHIDLSIRT